ncbi:MAG: ATP-dependent Clp protease ATP-binding subunit [Patescibacteria group bacterium]
MDAKFFFSLKETQIYQTVKWDRFHIFSLAKVLSRVFFVLLVLDLFLFLYGFPGSNFSDSANSALLGFFLIFSTLSIGFKLEYSFFNLKLKKPKLALTINDALDGMKGVDLAEFLDFETAKAVDAADRFADSLRLPLTNSTVLFHFLLEKSRGLEFIFSRDLLDIKEIKSQLRVKMREYAAKEEAERGYTQDYQDTIWEALKIAQRRNHKHVAVGDVLSALATYDPVFQKILTDAGLKNADIENLSWWLESVKSSIRERKRWWEYHNLMRRGTLAKEWTAGYTITLDRYSVDWTEIAKKEGFPEIIGHEKEIEQAERVLARHENNNVLLVGEPGVGRKGVIQGLVRRAVLGLSLPDVNYKRVVELDMSGLLAGTKTSDELEGVLDKIFQESVLAGNVILVINEFHNFIGNKPGAGTADIAGVIFPYLNLPNFQIVAVCSFVGLHKNIEQNPSVLNLFEKVEVSEISEKETMMALENLVPFLEHKYKIFVSYPALREIISLSRRYLPSLPFPKKALDILDEVMIYAKKSAKAKILLPSHINAIITEKAQMPVGEMETKEKNILLNLEDLIHQRIINQAEAVTGVATALRRARAEVSARKGPMGTFLFLGPTGVGKTETSKALAQIYFGSESKMIRLDMSEFQEIKDISRLVGGIGEEGMLTTPVIESPFSLILLDEIEKAHPNILNLFLQVLDEGFLNDGQGRKVDFKNSIIIATSNAGYQVILEAVKTPDAWSGVKQKLFDYVFDKAIFRPEFINRFDAVVVFKPLNKENLLAIAELMLKSLKKHLKEKGIDFLITMSLKEKIVELSYNPTFGAREMKRVIQDKVENVLAEAMLSGALKRGDMAEIDPQEFKLKVKSV